MNFDFTLPIRPGDITYVVEKACDWRVHTEKVKAVCIMEDGVHIIPETCECIDILRDESEGCFIAEEEALSYADAHRPEPPYEYWRDALSWMDVERYVPYHSGWYYVRVGEYVCKAYYEKDKTGFYAGGEKISGVSSWITTLTGLDAALHAGE